VPTGTGATVRAKILRGELVVVRPLRRTDAPTLDRFLRDKRVTRFLPPRVRSESGRSFVERVLRDQRRRLGFAFAIVPKGSEEVVGQIRLFNWSPWEQSAELGYWLGRPYWGKGYGTDAVRLVCRFGFQSMNLHRVTAVVVAGNHQSEHALLKAGFQREGSSRKSGRIDDEWRDEWLYGMLEGELLEG